MFLFKPGREMDQHELEIKLGSSQASADVPKLAAGFTAFLVEVELTAPTGHTTPGRSG